MAESADAKRCTKNFNLNNDDKSNETKQSLLNKHPIFIEYENDEMLYPISELDKWKRKLEMIRTKTINKFKDARPPPLRRPTDNKPLHEVFQDIMDGKSSTTNSQDNENNVETCETSAKPEFNRKNTSIGCITSNPVNVDKANQLIIDRNVNGVNTADCTIATKNSKSKLKILPTKRTQPLKNKANKINKKN